MSAFWHPFANMAAVTGAGALAIERAEGIRVWDRDGNRYLDGIAGLWFCNVGYGRREIAEAVDAQIRRLPAYHTFGDLSNRPAEQLADRIAGLAPVPGSKVFFTSGGSDSIDSAAKLARRYWQLVGEPGRTVMISRERAYHGTHAYGTSIAGIDANRADLVGDVVTVPWDSVDAVVDAIAAAGPERVAAFLAGRGFGRREAVDFLAICSRISRRRCLRRFCRRWRRLLRALSFWRMVVTVSWRVCGGASAAGGV